MILGIFILVSFYIAAEAIVQWTGAPVPGSVVAMMLLFAALLSKIIQPAWIEKATGFFLKNILLFFIPVSVGIMEQTEILSRNLTAILLSVTVSSVIVVATVGYVLQKLLNRNGNK